jgi:peroxiredoxin
MPRTIELLEPSGAAVLVDGDVQGDALWLDRADLLAATGFELKPEGLCRDELCYPLPPGREAEFVRDGHVNVAAFWRHRGGAVIATENGDTWALGDAMDERRARMDALEAPDFTLPDSSGEMHSLSDYRGQKVLLTTWASWCGCRRDLAVWQRLTEEVGGEKLKVIAVALDSAPGAAEPWIAEAKPTYPALIDREHHVAELYDLVNVPQAVWIDEEGRIVRPPEAAGAFDFLNKRKADDQALNEQLMEQSKETRLKYLDALKDWVTNGEASPYVYNEDDARARLRAPAPEVLEAHANFRLGQHLFAKGREAEALPFVERAKQLHPDSWAMFREAAQKLEEGPMAGIAAGPDFAARLAERAQAGKPYYAPIEIEGIPS